MMQSCNSQRILLGITILFIAATTVLAIVLIWRETRNLKSKLDETTVTQIYPGVFKSETEQRKILERYFKSFYYNRTIVNDTFLAEQTCAFSCGFIPQLGRKKRFSTGSFVYHGCCKSWVTVDAPFLLVNFRGRERRILQYSTLKQFFIIHHCSHMAGCTGCTCSQEDHVYSAVVHKDGVTDPDDVEDTEVDNFFLDGCCKCVNT